MVYRTSRCPSCGQVIRTQTNPIKKIGCPFERCRYCGTIYRNSYKEEWITKSPTRRFLFFLHIGVWARALIIPAFILIIPIAVFELRSDILRILWPILSLAWLVGGYFIHRDQAQGDIMASMYRTNDIQYINLLKQAGYKIYPLHNYGPPKRNVKKAVVITSSIVLCSALVTGILIFFLNSDNCAPKNDPLVITVALEEDFAPFSWSEDGEYYGLHVDIAKEIAKRNGASVNFVVSNFEDLLKGVDSGEFDLALGIYATEERSSIVSFTDPYYEGMCCIYHTEEDKPSFDEWKHYSKVVSDMIDDGTMDSLLLKYNLDSD